MTGLYVFAACLASGLSSGSEEFSVDVFLVANNATVIKSLDCLKGGSSADPIERELGQALKPFVQSKKEFVVIDGGNCTAFPATPNSREASLIHRRFADFHSQTGSTTINGVKKQRVLENTMTESTSILGFSPQPFSKSGYIYQTFVHFGPEPESPLSVAVQDLNSYRTAATKGTSKDRESLGKTILITGDSIQSCKRYLKENKFDFQGICIGSWGLSDPSDPNFISFPPSGKVAHYQLFRRDSKWVIRLVEYLTAEPTS